MRISKDPAYLLYALIAALAIVAAGLGYALWQESRSETITLEFGDERISVEAEGNN